jgi:hypothetical protein
MASVSTLYALSSAASVLLGFEAGIGLGWLLGEMVDGTIGLGANLSDFTLLQGFGDDGLGGVLAGLELRPFRLFGRLGFVLPNLNVLVASDDLAALRLPSVSGDDLYEFRLGG